MVLINLLWSSMVSCIVLNGMYADLEKFVNRPQAGIFRALHSPQNSMICNKGWTEIRASNVRVAWSNSRILSAYPNSIALNPQFLILNPPFSILLPQISFIQPQFSIFNSSFSILIKKYRIFRSKSSQNSVISNKMSASTACSFFQVCPEKSPNPINYHPTYLLVTLLS